jgi:hypothetical protein
VRSRLAILTFAFSLASGMGIAGPPPARSCQVQPVVFEGWNAQQIKNQWVTLMIVPQLGGRLMQVTFGEHAYLFVNPRFKGKYFPPSREQWFNYGGDKIWPLPEGREDEEHWPGPLADVLDDGNYAFSVLSQGTTCKVRLEGQADPHTGLQYAREITLGSDSPVISFDAVMRNASSHPIRWSMQSVTQYNTASAEALQSFNPNVWAFTPINPQSAYEDRYRIRLGAANDPAYAINNGLFTLHYLYFEREVWVDSTGGWLSIVDGTSEYAMVERFPHVAAEYPGKATVIFYTNGPALEFDEKGAPHLTSFDAATIPYYMEAEVNSPMVRLNPGKTYTLHTKWFPTRSDSNLQSMTDAGVIDTPLRATRNEKGVLLTGSFGVFFPGMLTAYFFNDQGGETGLSGLRQVDPLEQVKLNALVSPPPGTARVSIHVMDTDATDLGTLGAVAIETPGSRK